jgi:hypothetical protein
MATFLVRNSLNPRKVIEVGITYNQVTPKGNYGDAIWVIELATSEPSTTSGTIPPVYINNISSTHLDEEIRKAIGVIAAQVDWSPFDEDTREPIVEYVSPATYEVPIDSVLEMEIKDLLPSAGIDLDSIELTINDLDVSDELEITGDPYRYKIKWDTYLRVLEEE